MAYLDLQNGVALAPSFPAGIAAVEPAPAAMLSPLEWLVVAIAEHDGLASLHAPSRLTSVLGALFGSRRRPGLASPRLEVLRRVAVLLWQRRAIGPAEASGFHDAGYSAAQLGLVAASIAAGRARQGGGAR